MTDVECGHAIPMEPKAVFDAISNGRRRRVILSVDREDAPVTTNELSVEIAARENRVDPSMVTGEQRTRVYVALVQNHLGTLDTLGAARFDDRSKQVFPTEATGPLARLIRQITTDCYTPTGAGD
ncbi:hypothetical protein ACFQGE_00140 [Halomicroarcula sp. GCM10025817]|uniref:DUF7344 domain-containing protein n=1 Tax=Haloarcula TaxID=2237 RepID=UPI0023E76A2C|nr:hypothetical protein [Halomicroarcula sp. SYNS111]